VDHGPAGVRQGYKGEKIKIGKTELKQFRKAGITIPDIAKKLEVSESTIVKRIKEYGLVDTYKRVKPMSKRKIAEIEKTLPDGVNITWDTTRGGKGWRVTGKVTKNYELLFNKSYLNPDLNQIKQLVQDYEAAKKTHFPNSLSNTEFEKLRLSNTVSEKFKKKYKNLTSNQFAEVLNDLGHTTTQDLPFNKMRVDSVQRRLDLGGEVGEIIKPLTKTQQNTLMNAFPERAGQWDFKANKYGLNFSEIGKDEWNMLRNTVDDTKRWPQGSDAKSRLWHNAYRSALKGGDNGRFRILHPVDGEIMSRDEILRYNWTKGSSKVKFLDTLADETFDFNGFEKWMNKHAVPGEVDPNRFKNAKYKYELNKELKQVKVGDETFGQLLDKKYKGKASKQLRFSVFHNHHNYDIADNFWDTDVVFFKDNMELRKFEKGARESLRRAANLPEGERAAYLKSFADDFKKLGPIRMTEGPVTIGTYDFKEMVKTTGKKVPKKQIAAAEVSLKDFINQMDQGKATLIANSLNKGKFPKKICKTNYKAGKSVVCGVDFARDHSQEYLRKAGAMEEVGKFFKSAGGLNIARGVLNTAKYWTNPMTLGGGEAAYSFLAGWNERTKGASWGKAFNEAFWFIPGKSRRDREMLVGYEDPRQRELFPSMEKGQTLSDFGYEGMTSDQQEMFNVTGLAGNIEEQKDWQNRLYYKAVEIAEIEENIKKGTVLSEDVDRLAMLKKQLGMIEKEFQRIESKGEEMFEEYKTRRREVEGTTSLSEEQLYKPFRNLQTKSEQSLVDEYNKSLQHKYLQGDVESGKPWSKIKEIFGTDILGGTMLPFGKTAREAAMLRSMDARDRYRYNVNVRGLGYLRGPKDLTRQQWDVALQKVPELQYAIPMKGINYRAGGLANLTRTVAPDSGSVSRGLRSLYIDDMD
jgi:hypothetical protein